MKQTKLFILLSILFASLTFSSCSDDDDDDKDGGNNNGIENNDNNSSKGASAIFKKGLVKSSYFGTCNYDEQNRLTEIKSDDQTISFKYLENNQVELSVVPFNSISTRGDIGYTKFVFTLGKNGFAEKAIASYEDDDSTGEYTFEYNENGLLKYYKLVEFYDNQKKSGKNLETIAEIKDGNIISFQWIDTDIENGKQEIEDIYLTEYSYDNAPLNDAQLFSLAFEDDSDLGLGAAAYYAGILGKGTTNLPTKDTFSVKTPITEDDDEFSTEEKNKVDIYSYEWTFDNSHRPTKVTYKDEGSNPPYSYDRLFEWAN